MAVYGTQITIVHGAFVNKLITGGPHIPPASEKSLDDDLARRICAAGGFTRSIAGGGDPGAPGHLILPWW